MIILQKKPENTFPVNAVKIQFSWLFLRVLTGDEPLDISLAFDVGESNVYTYFHLCMKSVNKRFYFEPLPSTDEICRKSALRFATSRPCLNPLPGYVGAIDGISVMLQKPWDIFRSQKF